MIKNYLLTLQFQTRTNINARCYAFLIHSLYSGSPFQLQAWDTFLSSLVLFLRQGRARTTFMRLPRPCWQVQGHAAALLRLNLSLIDIAATVIKYVARQLRWFRRRKYCALRSVEVWLLQVLWSPWHQKRRRWWCEGVLPWAWRVLISLKIKGRWDLGYYYQRCRYLGWCW